MLRQDYLALLLLCLCVPLALSVNAPEAPHRRRPGEIRVIPTFRSRRGNSPRSTEECVDMMELADKCSLTPESGVARVLLRGTCSAALYGSKEALIVVGTIGVQLTEKIGPEVILKTPLSFQLACGVGILSTLFAGVSGGIVAGTSFCVYESARLCAGVPVADVIDDIYSIESKLELE